MLMIKYNIDSVLAICCLFRSIYILFLGKIEILGLIGDGEFSIGGSSFSEFVFISLDLHLFLEKPRKFYVSAIKIEK